MDILDKNLCNLLACPLCKGSLENDDLRFLCTKCNSAFPLNDGMISFINDEIIEKNQYLDEEISRQNKCLNIYTDASSLIYPFELFGLVQLSMAIQKKEGRVLDIGCGIGNLGNILEREIWGVDVSKTLLLRAKEKEKYVFQATGNYLPFVDNMFDIIFINNVLHHSNCPDKILDEAFRVLKPGGLLISADPRSCVLTKLAKLSRRNSPYYSRMHRSFAVKEYISMFEKRFDLESLGHSFYIFYLFAKVCDICRISKLIPFKNDFALILFRLDGLIAQLFKFMERYYFIITVVARKRNDE